MATHVSRSIMFFTEKSDANRMVLKRVPA
jgi:hypothetical protein